MWKNGVYVETLRVSVCIIAGKESLLNVARCNVTVFVTDDIDVFNLTNAIPAKLAQNPSQSIETMFEACLIRRFVGMGSEESTALYEGDRREATVVHSLLIDSIEYVDQSAGTTDSIRL